MEKCGNLLLPQFEAAISKSAGHGVGFSETKISCPAPKPQVHRSEKGKWGPVVRMSNMIKRDEKNSIVKAQELKQIQNLEVIWMTYRRRKLRSDRSEERRVGKECSW